MPTAQVQLGYLLGLSRKQCPKVLILATATGDSPESLAGYHKVFSELNCTVSNLILFDRTPRDLNELIASHDIVFVGGGNTKSMLAVFREYDLVRLLKSAWRRGIVLAGSSAGAICWFESCLTDSWADAYTELKGMGFLRGSCSPHYNGLERRATYRKMVRDGAILPGLAIDEEVSVHITGGHLQASVRRVISPDERTAYLVNIVDGKVQELALPTNQDLSVDISPQPQNSAGSCDYSSAY